MGADPLENAVLVVAHPDDEVLWFSSVLACVREIIICFTFIESRPEISRGRERLAQSHPLPRVTFLGLTEAEVFNAADWQAPTITDFGLAVVRRPETSACFSVDRYKNNAVCLSERLEPLLQQYTNVYTHNPWGEYGHEEHVQVHRIVHALAQRGGFNLWYSNYYSARSRKLMLRYLKGAGGGWLSLPTNATLAHALKALYQANNCWTWFGHYEWFARECFIRDCRNSGARTSEGVPLNYVALDDRPAPASRWRGAMRKVGNRIGRRANDVYTRLAHSFNTAHTRRR